MVGRTRSKRGRGNDGRHSVSDFDLSLTKLREVMELFRTRILEGLAQDGQEIAALPTYMSLPSGRQHGRALVIDTGGTNMRAALVEIAPGDGAILSGPFSDKVPDGRQGEALSSEEFFSAQAALSRQIEELKPELPLGYCFSYPAQSSPDGDAVLLRWTKGLRIQGVVGHKVGQALRESLKQEGFSTSGVKVLNDTVASLLGGAHLYAKPEYGTNYIGLILGTGTNMAGVFGRPHFSKVECTQPMVVNLESGNFNCPHLTALDDKLDAQSENPGAQRFEKAVSGHYLPQLFDLAQPGHNLGTDSSRLVSLRDSDSSEAGRTAAALLRRSARLTAAGLAAVASLYPSERHTAVLGEGGLLWGDSHFAPTVEKTLLELLPDHRVELVHQRENVNLLGAASAALG